MEYRINMSDMNKATLEPTPKELIGKSVVDHLITYDVSKYIIVSPEGADAYEVVLTMDDMDIKILDERCFFRLKDNKKVYKKEIEANEELKLSMLSAKLGDLSVLMWSKPEIYYNYALIKEPCKNREGFKEVRRKVVFLRRGNVHTSASSRLYPSRKISPHSHKYDVSGFWRKCKGLGKDRDGTYNQKGRTWVKNYIRGNGEYIYKTRVVKYHE